MKTKSLTLSAQRAFSLVELLVVIAVIAVIAAIAIPNISNITQQSKVAKNQRNAQNIASVAAAAKAAGVTTDLSTPTAAIGALSGTTVSVVLNKETITFGISALTPDEQTGATEFLKNSGTSTQPVIYNPSGTGTP